MYEQKSTYILKYRVTSSLLVQRFLNENSSHFFLFYNDVFTSSPRKCQYLSNLYYKGKHIHELWSCRIACEEIPEINFDFNKKFSLLNISWFYILHLQMKKKEFSITICLKFANFFMFYKIIFKHDYF